MQSSCRGACAGLQRQGTRRALRVHHGIRRFDVGRQIVHSLREKSIGDGGRYALPVPSAYYNDPPTTRDSDSPMKKTRLAWFVAAAGCVYAAGAGAAEGSALRGLKPPQGPVAFGPMSTAAAPGEARLKRTGAALPELTSRLALSGGTADMRRVATGDLDIRFGLHQPTGQHIPALADASIHSLQDVLPRFTAGSQMTRYLPGGWGIGLGVRQSDYAFTTSNLLSLSAERQWGNWRGAYTLYSTRTDGLGVGSAHRFEVSYLYGERNTVGLAYTTGRDIETFGTPAALIAGDARDWTLSGRHWLSPNWALTYDVMGHEMGAPYRRQGLRLGVSRSF